MMNGTTHRRGREGRRGESATSEDGSDRSPDRVGRANRPAPRRTRASCDAITESLANVTGPRSITARPREPPPLDRGRPRPSMFHVSPQSRQSCSTNSPLALKHTDDPLTKFVREGSSSGIVARSHICVFYETRSASRRRALRHFLAGGARAGRPRGWRIARIGRRAPRGGRSPR